MKKILSIAILLLLSSCTENTSLIESENIDSKTNVLVSDTKKIEEDISNKIVWNNDIKFTFCDSLSNYGDIEEFNKIDDNIREFSKITFDKNPRYTMWAIEYCRTSDFKKYIIIWNEYSSLIIYKYETDTKNIEEAELKWFLNSRYINSSWIRGIRNYGDISLEKYLNKYIESKKSVSWFGIKNNNIIPFTNYWVSITWHAESAPWIFADKRQFFSQSTIDYCSWWLTPKWKLSVCFADIFYDFDLVKNEIKESRICTYYIDDNWEIKTLERCFDFNHNFKWYNLKYKVKWMDLYQDNTWNMSVLDIDLTSAKIDFGWANTKFKIITERYNRAKIETDLEYEKENSELFRFNRFNASEFPSTFAREYYIKNNIHAVVNWQFFDQNKNPTFLSFPVKSNWKIINSHIDNDIPKRTFVIDSNWNAKILEWYKKEFLENQNYKDLIVGFTPDVIARKESKIWRTYIWINNSKNVVFFVAKNKTQEEMNKIISDYGIKKENIIMMDWWPSSQFSYYDNKWPWSEREQFYWESKVPHYFVIYTD